MPNYYKIGDIYVYFWSNEYSSGKLEPIHVHAWYSHTQNAPKLWVDKKGRYRWAHGEDQFSSKDRAKIEQSIEDNIDLIFEKWEEHFKEEAKVNTKIFCDK